MSDGLCHKTKVERNGPGAGAKDSEIDGQPLDTIGHQMDDPVPFFNSPGNKTLGHLIGLIVECFPSDFLTPVFFRFSFDKRCFRPIHTSISGQYLCDQHIYSFQFFSEWISNLYWLVKILVSFHPEMVFLPNLCVNLRNYLCGVPLVCLRVIP